MSCTLYLHMPVLSGHISACRLKWGTLVFMFGESLSNIFANRIRGDKCEEYSKLFGSLRYHCRQWLYDVPWPAVERQRFLQHDRAWYRRQRAADKAYGQTGGRNLINISYSCFVKITTLYFNYNVIQRDNQFTFVSICAIENVARISFPIGYYTKYCATVSQILSNFTFCYLQHSHVHIYTGNLLD